MAEKKFHVSRSRMFHPNHPSRRAHMDKNWEGNRKRVLYLGRHRQLIIRTKR